MRGVRVTIVTLTVLAGMHLLMLANPVTDPLHRQRPGPHCAPGDTTGMLTAERHQVVRAGMVEAGMVGLAAASHHAETTMVVAGSSASGCHRSGWHDLTMTCLAVLTSLLIAVVAVVLAGHRRTPIVLALRRWVAPVARPPTPPPIALGISRT